MIKQLSKLMKNLNIESLSIEKSNKLSAIQESNRYVILGLILVTLIMFFCFFCSYSN